jgi:hypothetical protein
VDSESDVGVAKPGSLIEENNEPEHDDSAANPSHMERAAPEHDDSLDSLDDDSRARRQLPSTTTTTSPSHRKREGPEHDDSAANPAYE